MRSRARVAAVAAVAVAGIALAGCSNSKSSSGGSSGGGTSQGVTSNEVKIATIADITGPLAGGYNDINNGVQAYIGMINDQGGVNGRKITIVKKVDDQTNGTVQLSQAKELVQQDKVFAIVGVAASVFPAGTYLGQVGIPTFGWLIDAEWAHSPNLFGQSGSYINFTGVGQTLPWLAKKLGATKVASIAYTVAQSAGCAKGNENSFKTFGLDNVLTDTSLSFGATDISADIDQLKKSGAQFVATCMDPNGNTLLASSLKKAGLTDVKQYWPNGYSSDTLAKFTDLMQGVYFAPAFVPFEAAGDNPGMKKFVDALNKYVPGAKPTEVALAGWIDADLFVTGLRGAGQNPTWSGVVDTINKIKNYTADGIEPPVDWTVAHNGDSPYLCNAFLQVQGDKFVPMFGEDNTPFVCWKRGSGTLDTVPYSQAVAGNG